MKRKVSKIGPATLMVSLPSKWVKKYGVKKGDEVDVKEDKEEYLVISTKERIEMPKRIDLDATSPYFNDIYLCYCYRAGYDEVAIKFNDLKIFNEIKDKATTLIGYEIMEQKENFCLIKNVSSPLSSEFDSFFRKLFITTLDMGESLVSALKNKSFEKLKEIRLIESTNNTFFEFISRILHKEGYKENKKTLYLYNIDRDIERICDHFKYMIDYILQNKKVKIDKETLDYFESTNKYIRTFYELFYKFDKEKLDWLSKSRYELIRKGYEFYDRGNHKEGVVIFHLITIVQMIFDLVGPVYSIYLMNNLPKSSQIF